MTSTKLDYKFDRKYKAGISGDTKETTKAYHLTLENQGNF